MEQSYLIQADMSFVNERLLHLAVMVFLTSLSKVLKVCSREMSVVVESIVSLPPDMDQACVCIFV
ncbi:hypothetical protein DY000_02039103 [Brassica cretica]|uniref:Uncharacterized protein n=1 Tax=Brassica cretica TaxID=69181 RepID=A0ABQ7BP35_BRACR|nr:hypothetical protein DY000_02039103 [Brassica cretica]